MPTATKTKPSKKKEKPVKDGKKRIWVTMDQFTQNNLEILKKEIEKTVPAFFRGRLSDSSVIAGLLSRARAEIEGGSFSIDDYFPKAPQ